MDNGVQSIERVIRSGAHGSFNNHGQLSSHIGQNRLHEVIFRGEPIQQGLLGDPDFSRDLIEADGIKSPGPEQNCGTF
jgi:hypothetical protein